MKLDTINLLGVLASEKEMAENNQRGFERSSCFVNKYDAIQFYLKIISERPKGVEKYITAFSNRIDIFKDNGAHDDDVRVNDYKQQLEKCLFSFSFTMNSSGYPVVNNIMKISKPDTYNSEQYFFTVPTYYSLKDIKNFDGANNKRYKTLEDFLQRIIEKSNLGTVSHFNSEGEMPQYVLFQDNATLYAVGLFTSSTYDDAGFKFEYKELRYLEFEETWYEYSFCFSENKDVYYVENTINNDIKRGLIENGTIYDEFYENVQQEQFEEETVEINPDAEIELLENADAKEQKLIDRFQYVAWKDGLYYSRKDLMNFHTAVKTGSLVILSGMSGTGKSQLVNCYVKSLGLEDEEYKMIPVRPSWNDDSDLIGFVDSMHMIYRPSDTGFVNILKRSSEEKNKDELFIVCLDEMNLARVEHYFSQFLSILEMPERQRYLHLYDEEFDKKLYNSDKYPSMIEIGNNIRFIGTVNIDESTFHFSDKVLDRANVIKLEVLPYTEWGKEISEAPVVENIHWKYSDYDSLIKKKKMIPLNDREREFLWKMHTKLNAINANLGVGPRILKQIGHYLENIPQSPDFTRKIAFDIQLVQRILTKIRGTSEQLQRLIDEKDNSSLINIMLDYKDISDFTESINVVNQKKQELELYGYAL